MINDLSDGPGRERERAAMRGTGDDGAECEEVRRDRAYAAAKWKRSAATHSQNSEPGAHLCQVRAQKPTSLLSLFPVFFAPLLL